MEGYLSTGGRLPAANFLTYQLRCAEIEQFNRSAIAIRWDSLAQGTRPKSPAELRHRRAGEPTNLPRSHPLRTLQLRHHWLLKKGENCNLSVEPASGGNLIRNTPSRTTFSFAISMRVPAALLRRSSFRTSDPRKKDAN